jgi:hypothetical protein
MKMKRITRFHLFISYNIYLKYLKIDRGRDGTVVGLPTTCAISAYHY